MIIDPDRIRQIDPNVDDFLIRMDQLNLEFTELREQMYDYLQEHDFQRDTAIELMDVWLDNGEVPQEWLDYIADADKSTDEEKEDEPLAVEQH